MKVGDKYGRLTVVELGVEKEKDGHYKHRFKCDCGNEIVAGQKNVKRKNTRSCGCLQSEVAKKTIPIVARLGGACGTKKKKDNCTSIYKGAHWCKSKMRWRATISINNKIQHLGYFSKEIDAVYAYDKAILKYYRKPVTNFPNDKGFPYLYPVPESEEG
jgi:hypothetical protein